MADAVMRTERATATRREQARRRGEVVVSSEIAPAAVLLVVLAIASAGAPLLVERVGLVLREWLAAAGPTAIAGDAVSPLAWRSVRMLAPVLAPFLVAVTMVGAGAVAAQVGWHPSLGLVAPDPARIGFAAGWKRLVSLDGAARAVKAVVTIGLVAVAGWWGLVHLGERGLGASSMPVDGTLALAGGGLRQLGLVMAGALAAVGAADYAWVRWRSEQRLKMSRHELREERRQSEGDPQVRRRFHRAHREIAACRGLDEVARADVVVVDPARVAVALRYRAEEGGTPRVLAQAAGALAGRIEQAARAAGVPIVERRALARALVRAIAPGSEIPHAFDRAVAEVLAHVYALDAAGARP